MFVRSWNPRSGELIAWMPEHSASMILQLLPGAQPPDFENDSVFTAYLPCRNKTEEINTVRAAPEVRHFDNQDWLPAQRDINLVRIHDSYFYVRSIDFSDKWRQSRGSGQKTSAPPSQRAFVEPRSEH